jgi:hypothetical protein
LIGKLTLPISSPSLHFGTAMNLKIVAAIIAGISIVAIPSCIQSQSELNTVMASVDAATKKQELSDAWAYDERTDEMRGEVTRYASIRADGWVPMEPELFVQRDKDRRGLIAIRGSLDESTAPQMLCSDGSLNIKFDENRVQKVNCLMGSSAVVIDSSVFEQLEKSDVTWIEIHTTIGTMQYKFNTKNLTI